MRGQRRHPAEAPTRPARPESAGRWPLLVALCLLWALPAPQPADPRGAGPPADASPAVAATAPTTASSPPAGPAPSAVPAPWVVTASSARPSAGPSPPRVLAEDEALICGLGTVRVDDAAPTPQDHIPAATRTLARERLARTMSTQADGRVRAAALLMTVRAGLSGSAVSEARTQDAVCRRARADGLVDLMAFCADEAARRQAELMAPLQAAIDQLARLAAVSDDPVVLAFAQEACEPQGLSQLEPPGSCQLAGAAAWARRVPQAAEPWLLLAALSHGRGDPAGAAQALARAARATRVDSTSGALAALAGQAMPAGLAGLEQASILADLAQLDEGVPQAVPLAVDALCDTAALADPARRADCDALARLLVDQGRTAATLGAGLQLGERLGWPAERTGRLWRGLQAAMAARHRHLAAGGSLSCEGLARRRALAALSWQVGELEAGRRVAAR